MKKLLALLLIFSLLASCKASPNKQSSTFFALDTIISVTLYGEGSALTAVSDEIMRLDSIFDADDPESALWQLNHSESFPAEVPDELLELCSVCLEYYRETGGVFDIALQDLISAYGFGSDFPHCPSDFELSELLARCGSDKVSISGKKICLDGVRLSFGAAAKGYIASRCACLLREQGVSSAILSLGGNVQAVGSKPDGSPWQVALTDPADISKSVGILKISDCAAVTSGAYYRFFEEDGRIIHHILDPKTGKSADSGLLSVTVIASDGTRADALSTALFVMGLERGLEFCSASDDFEAIFITDDNRIVATPNVDFTVSSEAYAFETAFS